MPDKVVRRFLAYRIPAGDDAITGGFWVTDQKQPLWRLTEFAFAIEQQAALWTRAKVRQEGQKISCRSGCSVCCRQPVPLSPCESLYLTRLVSRLPHSQKLPVSQRLRQARATWRKEGPALASPFHAAKEYFALGIDCPFLVEHSCSIHSQRPLACREHSVTSEAAFCGGFPHPSIRMAAIPFSIGEALRRACAKLFNTAPVAIPLISATQWKIPPGIKTRRFTEEELLRSLIVELGGSLLENRDPKKNPPPEGSGLL